MQLAPNRNVFEMMTDLFCKKWNELEPNFVEYFKTQWLEVHRNWFEGAADYTPSTNNAVESHNAVIKRKVTFRRKLPLGKFLIAMKTMTADVSIQFGEDKRTIAMEPIICRDTIMEAAKMDNDGFVTFKAKERTSGRTVHVFL